MAWQAAVLESPVLQPADLQCWDFQVISSAPASNAAAIEQSSHTFYQTVPVKLRG
ncbi:hypothetical protein FNL37_2781 [Methylovorus glucosotrophus]|uniref:Uncharacterized protein n=1 Tax=Methylovorus glucosotrophus (strain SIP3-4) TaxID=582744 RepID=C6X9P1_METGS|nr:hypothetical protein Msip34_0613 [Methylovorus glucosotrophus SIP3-4]KAF0836471.1 hypothetical protein FNL37_2781 [Methylovorus glucosotrophus]